MTLEILTNTGIGGTDGMPGTMPGFIGAPAGDTMVASADPFDDFDDDDFDDEFDEDFEEEWDDELPGDQDQFEKDDEDTDAPFSDDPEFDEE